MGNKSLRAADTGRSAISRRTAVRLAAAALVTLGLTGCAAQAHTYLPPVEQLVSVDVYDRNDRSALPAYTKDGRRYIVGTPGHEYAVRIRNRTAARVLVVTSVDGVNVISGDTAAPSQSGYVLEPWGSVEIMGWRKSLQRTAAFFFTEHQNSYAARTGRPNDVGVIGVAVFQEKPQPVARYRAPPPAPIASGAAAERRESAADAEVPAPSPSRAEASSTLGIRGLDREDLSRQDSAQPKTMNKLGTGHGRNEASPVRMVNFERASESPAETVAIQYDRRENLIAMGVLPQTARVTRREPDPFPGMRFAPDPR